MRPLLLSSSLALLFACATAGMPAETTPAVVQTRAHDGFLKEYAETFRFRLGRPNAITITPKGDAVLFLRSGPRSPVQDLFSFDPKTGEEKVLLTASQILEGAEEELSEEEKARRERMRQAARGIASFQLSADGEKILVPLSGRLFVVERGSGKVVELPEEGGYPVDPRFSPDGRKVAVVRDGDLYVIDVATKKQRRLTRRDKPSVTWGMAEFVAQEEMGRMQGYWWSPDGRQLAVQRTDVAGLETTYIADATAPWRAPSSWAYPRPGKKNAEVSLHLLPVAGGRAKEIRWDRQAFPYLATVRWQKNAPLTLLVQDRRQREEQVLAVDEKSGATRTLLTEKDDAWLNLDQQMPRWLPGGKEFLWTTERNGAWQLELRDASGKLLRALTEPSLGYRGFVRWSDEALIVRASADPTQQHVYRVPLDGSAPVALTSEPGVWNVVDEGELSVYTVAPLQGPTRSEVHTSDGRVLALKSVAAAPSLQPSVELLRLGGELDLAAAVIRPADFDPDRRYPAIVSVYGGPHAQVVQASSERYLLQQWMAEQGFIVVSVDGRGTPNRGRDFERAIAGNLIELPLQDQVTGLRQLAERIPQMDLSRVGIYGWSFGGYFSAMAVMQRPDVFHAGIAGAPVTDWLDYDTHYTERYLGLPEENEAGYRASSVLNWADRLERPLLVVHGTADDNVYFAHALKMSDAIFRAGGDHEFLPLAGFTHMVLDPTVTEIMYGRFASFLQRHLAN